MCLASASVKQNRVFPQKCEDFFHRANMIGQRRFHRWRERTKFNSRGSKFDPIW
jgi:hypothetical protein